MPSTPNPQPSTVVPGNPSRWLRRLAWTLAIVSLLAGTGYLFRAPLLTGLANAWVVNDPVTKADAIVILGGGLENRPFAAAKLYHDGVAPQILYMDVRLTPAEEMGITLPEKEQTRRILLSNNVPETAVTMIGTNVASTYDESKAVCTWIEKSGAKSIIITTDPFHTRRARWVFIRELRGTKTEVHVIAINPVRYRAADWWRHEEGVIAFQNEIIKLFYYRFKYWNKFYRSAFANFGKWILPSFILKHSLIRERLWARHACHQLSILKSVLGPYDVSLPPIRWF
jgi:uncharacterized SAM-binding protein YcdF (DUF218 family)